MNDFATQETIAAASIAAVKVPPVWVARVLPLVVALMDEYKTKYNNEIKALTPKDWREGRSAATNPNIWTHLVGVADYLKAGDYDEALEMLGTMVGMGRGIGNWVGGDAAKAIENLIGSIRAETDDTHPNSPSKTEMEAGRAAITKKRYLRLEGMSGREALLNDKFSASFGGQIRLDLVIADDPKIHPPYRRGQYIVFKRDGRLYARQWNVSNGFHDRVLTIIDGEPFRPVLPPLQKGTETAGTPMENARWQTAHEYGSKAGVVLGYTRGEDGRDLVRFRADNGGVIDLPPHMLFPETPATEGAIALVKGNLVAWTAGGHQMVGELLNIDGDIAMVARLVSGGGIRPELKKVPVSRLRLAKAQGAEASALAAHHKHAAQQEQWLEYHDKQFETYHPTSSPDASYAKDFTLTSEAMLRQGLAHVVPNELIRSGQGQIYVERIENRFGKVVELRGYSVEPEASWTFITRPPVPGQLPKYGTEIQGQDGKSYVVGDQHTWQIMSQLSAGERVRIKQTSEEDVVKGDSGRRSHSFIVYSLQGGGMALSVEVERIDTDGDRVVTLEQLADGRESGMYAHNPYQADILEFELDPEGHYRTEAPNGPTVQDLCPLGTIVATNYSTGPYVVRTVSSHKWKGKRSWCLTCSQLGSKKADSYLNDYVAVDGRIRHLFGNNTDEVLILESPKETEINKTLRNKKGELGKNHDGAHFASSQGEWHQMPGRYAGIDARIGVLELEDGSWLSHPEGWWRWSRRFVSRDAALRYAIAKVLKLHRARFRGNSEGTHYLRSFVTSEQLQAVTTWALGLVNRKPPKLYTYDPISDVGNEDGEGVMATKFKFEKDEAVTYKGNQYYWIGRKVGSFRVLASQPGTESGFLVPETEIGETVFPAPNKHGVFHKKHAALIEFKKNSNFYVRIYTLQIASDAWIGAMETKTSTSGHSSPLSATRVHSSYEAVVKQELGPIIAGLAANAAGRSFPGWSSFKPAMAKQAILTLLSQVPPQLASEIIIYARSRAGEDRG